MPHGLATSKNDVEFLMYDFFTGSIRYKEDQIKILPGYLGWASNKNVSKMDIEFDDTSPTRIRWLEDDQERLVRAKTAGIELMT